MISRKCYNLDLYTFTKISTYLCECDNKIDIFSYVGKSDIKIIYSFLDSSLSPTYDGFKVYIKELHNKNLMKYWNKNGFDENIGKKYISGSMTKKNIKIWNSIPINIDNYLTPSVYSEYKQNWPNVNMDFGKYYKTRGLVLLQEKWKRKFAYLKPTDTTATLESTLPLSLTPRFFTILSDVYVRNNKKYPNRQLYWPLMTSIISHPLVRDDDKYFLITTKDILKIDYISSMILDYDILHKFHTNLANYFTLWGKRSVYKLYDRFLQDKKYRKLLKRTYARKVRIY